MKIALCISGGLRCFKETYAYTHKFLLSQFDVDVYFYGLENNEGKERNIKEFKELYNPKDFVINDIAYYNNISSLFTKYNIRYSVIPMFYNIYMCNELRKNSSINYDIVIRFRPDCFFARPVIITDLEEAKKGIILLPECWSFHGLTDLYAVANTEMYNKYAELFIYLKQYLDAGLTNPEVIVKHHIQQAQIPFMFIEKYMEHEFPDILDVEHPQGVLFSQAPSRNFKYNYDKQ